MLILDPPEVILEFKPGNVKPDGTGKEAKLLIQDCFALDKSGPRKEEVNEGGGGRGGGCSLWLITGHLTAPTTAADTDASPPTLKTMSNTKHTSFLQVKSIIFFISKQQHYIQVTSIEQVKCMHNGVSARNGLA